MDENIRVLEDGLKYAWEHNSFNKWNLVMEARNVCVFGLGRFFREAFVSKRMKETYHVNLLCDNDSELWGNTLEGLPVVSPKELAEYEELVVIIMLGEPLPVQRQLDEMGIRWVLHCDLSVDSELGLPREKEWFEGEIPKIREAYTLFEDAESKRIYVNAICNRIAYPTAAYRWEDLYSGGVYFGQPFFKFTKEEAYVDCGAYDGGTVKQFFETVKDYKAIYAFELDQENFRKMEEKIGEGHERIWLFQKGVLDENKVLLYGLGEGDNEPMEGISILKPAVGDICTAEVVRLDDALEGKEVTFIKMDVEGAELQALKGCRRLITEQSPKLAICVYHRTSDLWQIPILLHSFQNRYHLALRHHRKDRGIETVLYAYI